eukprot:gnl/TRDRNA2_/TRDRNA2_38850_c0_seq1.p1 gnl/TRDRNA2_/TRDRNA2_38850_c0~~gnl/TRDRNA2_/TRDRNA2_38850_c0_seq1.p1  ORF type:complete len:190 (-),score=45.39 gnl/TRDRNA2_/TRDRNA2_38850_c0_seq1:111-632(-)
MAVAADSGTSARRRLLFLDVDGVLHPNNQAAALSRGLAAVDDCCFVPSCMEQLHRVVAQTGAEIVLSSDWRRFDTSRAVLTDALAKYGMHFERWTSVADKEGGRADQILEFVQKDGADRFAVLDDLDIITHESMMMQIVRASFVRTDGDVGLTEADADKAIEILLEESDEEDN